MAEYLFSTEEGIRTLFGEILWKSKMRLRAAENWMNRRNSCREEKEVEKETEKSFFLSEAQKKPLVDKAQRTIGEPIVSERKEEDVKEKTGRGTRVPRRNKCWEDREDVSQTILSNLHQRVHTWLISLASRNGAAL